MEIILGALAICFVMGVISGLRESSRNRQTRLYNQRHAQRSGTQGRKAEGLTSRSTSKSAVTIDVRLDPTLTVTTPAGVTRIMMSNADTFKSASSDDAFVEVKGEGGQVTAVDIVPPGAEPATLAEWESTLDKPYYIPGAINMFPSKYFKAMKWVGPGESMVICDRLITGGLFYTGPAEKRDAWIVDPSVIDPTKPASKAKAKLGSDLHTDNSLLTRNSYTHLSLSCRGAYLDFLASDRSDPGTPIEYVYMYFFGLERRVFTNTKKESVSDVEYVTIFDEIMRLRRVFTDSRPFQRHAGQCASLMALMRPNLLRHRTQEFYPNPPAEWVQHLVAVRITQSQPISVDLAVDWINAESIIPRRAAVKRCERELLQLIRMRLMRQFPEGIRYPPKTKGSHDLLYIPANHTLKHISMPGPTVFNIYQLPETAPNLVELVNGCIRDLEPYIRYLGKKGANRTDIAAVRLLPKELQQLNENNPLQKFNDWAHQLIQSSNGLTEVSSLFQNLGQASLLSLGQKESVLISSVCTDVGIGFAPNPLFHSIRPAVDGKIVLHKLLDDSAIGTSPTFYQVLLALRLGVMVAKASGEISAEELSALRIIILKDPHLSSNERESLLAFLTWQIVSPVNKAGIAATIKEMSKAQIEFLRLVILSIAMADGHVQTAAIKQIEKLYASLGLDKSNVAGDIHALTAGRRLKRMVGGSNQEEQGTGFNLNEQVLAVHESETLDAKAMLSTIFAEGDGVVSASAATPAESSNQSTGFDAGGLEPTHGQLYTRLITKERWARSEVIALCSELGLMLEGALETINDWAYDRADAPVFEDDGDIIVDIEVVEELKG